MARRYARMSVKHLALYADQLIVRPDRDTTAPSEIGRRQVTKMVTVEAKTASIWLQATELSG